MAKVIELGISFVSDVVMKMSVIIIGFLIVDMLCISGCK